MKDFISRHLSLKYKEPEVFDVIEVLDKQLAEFLKLCNGGWFFNNALHIYGYDPSNAHHDALLINKKMSVYNSTLKENLYFFACDVFGNQFVIQDGQIFMMQIDSGDLKFISKNFSEWLSEIEKEPDYYTGFSLLLKYIQKYGAINSNERLCVVLPFVLGGKFEIGNLKKLDFLRCIDYNIDIFKQIYNLPNGAQVILKTIE